MTADDPARWYFGGRYYAVTAFSDVATRDGYGWELDDIAPAPARGLVLEAFWDDTTGQFTFWAKSDEPLPFALVEHFVTEARKDVPPREAVETIGAGNPALRCPVCQSSLTARPYADYDGTVPVGASPPYEDLLGAPSYEVCPGCDFEFGNDDNPGTAPPVSFEDYRREWRQKHSG